MARDDVKSNEPAQPLIPQGGESVAKELSESVRGSGAVMLPTASAQGIDPVAHMDGAPVASAQGPTASQDGGSVATQSGTTSQSSSSDE
jgi:hypothetical protein